MSEDERIAFRNCRIAQENKEEIGDATARVIASWYASGRSSQSFVTTGTITDPSELWRDLVNMDSNGDSLYHSASPDHKLALDMLGTYLLNREDHGPVPGWSELWVR